MKASIEIGSITLKFDGDSEEARALQESLTAGLRRETFSESIANMFGNPELQPVLINLITAIKAYLGGVSRSFHCDRGPETFTCDTPSPEAVTHAAMQELSTILGVPYDPQDPTKHIDALIQALSTRVFVATGSTPSNDASKTGTNVKNPVGSVAEVDADHR